MKLISIVSGAYNEEDNISELYLQVSKIIQKFPHYDFEQIIIDNFSTDRTRDILRQLSAENPKFKVILNTRNFGHVRSPYYGVLQASGDAVIYLASDLQDPPKYIEDFIIKWEEGYKIVFGIKNQSEEFPVFFIARKIYYWFASKLSDVPLIQNSTGFGLYDKSVIDVVRKIDDPYPYLRGLICEIGFPIAQIPFVQPRRKRGITKNNFYTLYDVAMLGITSHSKIPLRLATMFGFLMSLVLFLIALIYFVLKLVLWDTFALGLAPLLIGIFFLGSIQLFFIGILGEYIGAIYTQVLKRPLVIEEERINF